MSVTASRFYSITSAVIPSTSPATIAQDSSDFVYAQFASSATTYIKMLIGLDNWNTTTFTVMPVFKPSSAVAGNFICTFDASGNGTTWGTTATSTSSCAASTAKQEGSFSTPITPSAILGNDLMLRITRSPTSDTVGDLINLVGVWVKWGATRS
jgi:hypothetical protein